MIAPAPPSAPPRESAWSRTLVSLCLAGLALGWLGVEALRRTPPDSTDALVNMAALAVGGAAFLLGILGLARHFRQTAPAAAVAVGERAAARDAGALSVGAAPAVLRCLDQPALLVGETGRVLHMNPAATAFLDARAVAPSAGVFQLVEPADLRQALAAARSGRGAARALLRLRDGGGDIAVRVADVGFQAGMAIVFENAAAIPPPPPRPGGRWGAAFDSALPLAAVPIVALWAEISAGRLRRLSTVKLAGGRVFPTLSLDFTIAGPDAPPPAAGRPFADIWPELALALKGALVAAENAAALWRLVQAEMQDAGFVPAEPPPLLELSRLAAGRDPGWAGLGLDELAARLAIGESNPARRLACVVAALALGPGMGSVGDFIGESGVISGDALKPAAESAHDGRDDVIP